MCFASQTQMLWHQGKTDYNPGNQQLDGCMSMDPVTEQGSHSHPDQYDLGGVLVLDLQVEWVQGSLLPACAPPARSHRWWQPQGVGEVQLGCELAGDGALHSLQGLPPEVLGLLRN